MSTKIVLLKIFVIDMDGQKMIRLWSWNNFGRWDRINRIAVLVAAVFSICKHLKEELVETISNPNKIRRSNQRLKSKSKQEWVAFNLKKAPIKFKIPWSLWMSIKEVTVWSKYLSPNNSSLSMQSHLRRWAFSIENKNLLTLNFTWRMIPKGPQVKSISGLLSKVTRSNRNLSKIFSKTMMSSSN